MSGDDGQTRPLGVAVLGLGFMGAQHVDAYRIAAASGLPNRLVAVCDPDPARREGARSGAGNLDQATGDLFDPAEVRAHADPEPVLADPDVELVSVCTWTDSHVPLSIAALEAGKHVLVEKPVALTSEAVAELLAVAEARPRQVCMPAMCIRFWPGWSWLAERVRDGSLGALRKLEVRRLAPAPDWSTDFYDDPARSGGVLVDLHVHDADFVRWCLGHPAAVTVTGEPEHLHARYEYAEGPEEVTVEAAWLRAPAARFSMGYRATFEEAVADYSSGREPLLRLERRYQVVEPVALAQATGYEHEVRHVLEAVANLRHGEPPAPLQAPLADALPLLQLLEAERRSLDAGGTRVEL